MSEYIESKLNLRKIWKKWKKGEESNYVGIYWNLAKSNIEMKNWKK